MQLLARSEAIEKVRDRQSDIQVEANFCQNKIRELECLVLRLGAERSELQGQVARAKADLAHHETQQRLHSTRIEFASESNELLGEEVTWLQELLAAKKGEGEAIYTDMRDHLSTQEDGILAAAESANNFARHLGAQQRKLQADLTADLAKLRHPNQQQAEDDRSLEFAMQQLNLSMGSRADTRDRLLSVRDEVSSVLLPPESESGAGGRSGE